MNQLAEPTPPRPHARLKDAVQGFLGPIRPADDTRPTGVEGTGVAVTNMCCGTGAPELIQRHSPGKGHPVPPPREYPNSVYQACQSFEPDRLFSLPSSPFLRKRWPPWPPRRRDPKAQRSSGSFGWRTPSNCPLVSLSLSHIFPHAFCLADLQPSVGSGLQGVLDMVSTHVGRG